MFEIVKVNFENETPTVSARELHEFLEVKTPYDKWFPRMCEYGFLEGRDFSTFLSESTGGRPARDAALTIDMAKEICMIQRTERGKQAREYFIKLEKAWNSPEQVMARALKLADKRIESLAGQIEEMKPHAVLGQAITTANTSILVGDLAKLLKQNGVKTGANRMFEWLRENGYLIKRRGTDWNLPTQKSMEQGLFEIKESVHIDGNGCNKITRTPKVTGKGQEFFINKFLAANKPKVG